MSSILGFLKRSWIELHPPQPAKTANALRIGLLGASTIAPSAIITPAKSHPEVIIAAIAARDQTKAKAYAQKYGIPIVHKSYQELLDDPAIDAVYIPLPNGLHYEWALKSLKAGKHVLLEKPSVSNTHEATSLFNHPLLQKPNAPVLLEAFHPLFHPAFQKFLSLLSPSSIVSASASFHLISLHFPNDDIRFIYDLSGGTLMDLGTYMVLAVRCMLGTEPEECVEAVPTLMPAGYDQKCDRAMKASWRFPNGAVGSVDADLKAKGGYQWPWLTSWIPTIDIPKASAVHAEAEVRNSELPAEQEHVVVKTVKMRNFIGPGMWHSIDVEDKHTIRNKSNKSVIKSWTEVRHEKAYKWDGDRKGEEWWSTYRYQLEAFVDRVKGRKGTGIWMESEDSVKQMQMIDGAYLKAGLPLRPTSEFKL